LNFYLRQLERKDIPRVLTWMSGSDFPLQTLSDYPLKNQKLLKNQLLKEITLPKFIASSTQLLAGEVNGEVLVAFIMLKNIDWKSRHLDLQIYVPPEFRQTDIPLLTTTQIYNYIFQELNMHKIYTYVTSFDQEKLKVMKAHQKEPEAVLYNYLTDGKNYYDLQIYSTFKRDLLPHS
jgi:RimJ/RimL family protein N-acetyltransferase